MCNEKGKKRVNARLEVVIQGLFWEGEKVVQIPGG